MRRAALTSLVAAVAFAGAFAFAAAGGDPAYGTDIRDASARTAHAASVHYAVDVTLTKAQKPMTLAIRGASSHDRLAVDLSLGTLTGRIMLNRPFLYEKAPQGGGMQVFGGIDWLRMQMTGLSERGRVLSTLRSLTPAPLLHVIAEADLRPTTMRGVWTGPVAYDDPVVRTSLHDLGDGLEFRGLQLRVVVGRDGLVHRVRLTGRTPDGKTSLDLRARLFSFGKAVVVTPPKPGTFMDPALEQLQA